MPYAVIQPDGPHYGIVLSLHRSIEAAENKIIREHQSLIRKNNPAADLWLDRSILLVQQDVKPRMRIHRQTGVGKGNG